MANLAQTPDEFPDVMLHRQNHFHNHTLNRDSLPIQ